MAQSPTPMTMTLAQQADYRFETRFDAGALPAMTTDLMPPLGGGRGPNPEQLLGAAVANCLAASLLYSLRRYKVAAEPLRAEASVTEARNAKNRLRIGHIGVDLHLGPVSAGAELLPRVLAQFEDFCTVTQSIRAGIDVDVRVHGHDGALLWPPAEGAAAPA